MNRPGYMNDNVFVETFFQTLNLNVSPVIKIGR
jgi:hypothetical protein